MSTPNTLGSAAQDRKARLAHLRSLKRKQPEPSDEGDAEQNDNALVSSNADAQAEADMDVDDVKQKYLSGRNYDHSTGTVKLGFENAPDEGEETLEKKAAELQEKIRQQAAEQAKKDEPLDLFKLQPKRPNWDLKRDLKQRSEILDIRTDNAIARLVRERIQAQQKNNGSETGGLDGADLVEAVHVREREEEEEEAREREWEKNLANTDP